MATSQAARIIEKFVTQERLAQALGCRRASSPDGSAGDSFQRPSSRACSTQPENSRRRLSRRFLRRAARQRLCKGCGGMRDVIAAGLDGGSIDGCLGISTLWADFADFQTSPSARTLRQDLRSHLARLQADREASSPSQRRACSSPPRASASPSPADAASIRPARQRGHQPG